MTTLPSLFPETIKEQVFECAQKSGEFNYSQSNALLDQVSLREKRDYAFRELRSIVKMVKETGRFAFRNNPDMKRRYR